MPRVRRIPVVLRGYDVAEVDNLLARAERALASRKELELAQARQALRSATFRRRLRGYSPNAVQGMIAQLSRQLGIMA
jgi:DivIVA domain-containing protein